MQLRSAKQPYSDSPHSWSPSAALRHALDAFAALSIDERACFRTMIRLDVFDILRSDSVLAACLQRMCLDDVPKIRAA